MNMHTRKHSANRVNLFVKAVTGLSIIVTALLLISFQKNKDLKAQNRVLTEEKMNLEDQLADLTTLKNGVAEHGHLQVQGVQLCDEKGNPVVLRGISSHGLTWYPEYTNYQSLKTWKEYGANVFRVSMYVEQDLGYLEEPELNQKLLYASIENSLAADLYTIVDWHVLRDENPNRHVEEALEFFDDISKRYKNEPGIIYEICNEPNGDTAWDDVCDYAEKVIPVIRKNSQNALILVGTPNYCTDFSGPVNDPLSFENIMYTMHRYVDASKENPCDTYLIEKVVNNNIPVFVSEWGVGQDWEQEKETDREETLEYIQNADPFVEYMDEHQISWVAWALANGDSLHSIVNEDCDRLGNWEKEELTSFGRYLVQHLSE